MAKGKPGADSYAAVTSQIAGKSLLQLASELYGEAPVFWGRYFTSITQPGSVEYRHLKENHPLRDQGIRVAPIARQTHRVQGARADGAADALRNAEDYIATFGADYLASQGSRFFVFLDVEGAPSLSREYYAGWATTLAEHSSAMTNGSVNLVPCVYATQSDNSTWTAVSAGAASGVPCGGAWIARWRFDGCHALEDWDQTTFTWALKDMQIVSKMADSAGLSFPLTGAVKELVKEARRIKATNPPKWTRSGA